MEQTLTRGTDDRAKAAKSIIVQVNTRPVVFHQHEATGAEIKAAAIVQGVAIQGDFVLFEVKHDELRQIGDTEVVRLHEHETFRAVAPDDNSDGRP